MLRYVDNLVGFAEVPKEISLCVNISGCKIQCPDCHSKYLWENKGKKLTTKEVDTLIKKNEGISCFCIMGGDHNEEYIVKLAKYISSKYPQLKIAWYSGKNCFTPYMSENKTLFNYIKIGEYKKDRGALNCKTTNQRMYKIYPDGNMEDITSLFFK